MLHRKISLSHQLPLLFIISYAVIAIIVMVFVYHRFEVRMVQDYTMMGEGVTTLMAEAIDTDMIDEYIEKNYSWDEYNKILKYYYSLKDNYPDVHYMYVYRFNKSDPPGATVIIDLDEEYTDDPPQDSIDWIGEVYEVDAPFDSELDDIIENGVPVYHTVHTKDGEYLLSYVRPVFDKDGNYSCSACVDFSMTEMHRQDIAFVLRLGLTLGAAILVILLLNIWIIRKKVTTPLERIGNCIDGFRYETEEDQFFNLTAVEDLGIMNNDEIGSLYNSLLTTMKESVFYMSHLKQAKTEIKAKEENIEKISKMTYKDALTGVGNKSAYVRDLAEYNTKISEEGEKLSAVMVDVNNLKYVNDTFGHEKGDIYIQGSCKMICDVFSHSPVYRIGGDEFVVILGKDDRSSGDMLYHRLMRHFEKTYLDESAEAWERFSASCGLAEGKSGETAEEVIKRADETMYKNKLAFKEKYGSYR